MRRLVTSLKSRWVYEDYPGGEKRFQALSLARDVSVFVGFPACAVLISKLSQVPPSKPPAKHYVASVRPVENSDLGKYQVMRFGEGGSHPYPVGRNAPGTLLRLKLLNLAEDVSGSPVYAQIVDMGLGKRFYGGTLIGAASGNATLGRVAVTFTYVRPAARQDIAFRISARALSLQGTLGLDAQKRDGIVQRASANAAATASGSLGVGQGDLDAKSLILRALTAGLSQQIAGDVKVEGNSSEVLTLEPGTEFIGELTDFFPLDQK